MGQPLRTNRRFAALFLLLLLLLVLQLRLGAGVRLGELVLATLLVAAVFLRPYQIIFLSLFSALVLTWRPALTMETLLLLLLPVAIYFLRRLLPGKELVNGFVWGLIGASIFIIAESPRTAASRPILALTILASSAVWILLVSGALSLLYTHEEKAL